MKTIYILLITLLLLTTQSYARNHHNLNNDDYEEQNYENFDNDENMYKLKDINNKLNYLYDKRQKLVFRTQYARTHKNFTDEEDLKDALEKIQNIIIVLEAQKQELTQYLQSQKRWR